MFDSFLMQSWAGLPIAIFVVLVGIWLFRRVHSFGGRLIAGVIGIAGMLLLLGAGFATSKGRHGMEPPGKMVDVGGHRIHVWCEGEGPGPTVVWLPGGYGQGLFSYRNHQDIRGDVRSCLVDRHNLGWSDAGPWEFSPEAIANELMRALESAGETGPFLLAGHSYGGFYATNVAALYPQQIAGIALLDPTAPAWIDFFAYGMCGPGKPRGLHQFASLFGLVWIKPLNPLLQDDVLQENLGDFWPAFIAQEMRPRTFFAQAAALDTSCKDILSFVREPGQLGDTPILLITQVPRAVDDNDTLAPKEGFRRRNYLAFLENIDRSVLELSTNTRHLYAPDGAGHEFPKTEPLFTREQVLRFQRELR